MVNLKVLNVKLMNSVAVHRVAMMVRAEHLFLLVNTVLMNQKTCYVLVVILGVILSIMFVKTVIKIILEVIGSITVVMVNLLKI